MAAPTVDAAGRPRLDRRLAAEALGTCLPVATVVGSGIIAQTPAGEGQ